jgi:mannose-1-phosphate guanylyltransferase / mannose-6-phosphate isomerase
MQGREPSRGHPDGRVPARRRRRVMAGVSPLIPVILAGGAGTRLWPVSRGTRPKHLAPLTGDESLLQQAARRALARAAPEAVVTVGSQSQDYLLRDQLAAVAPGLGTHRLLEPVGRNTAAAVALAAVYIERTFTATASLWVCPSDHLIAQPKALYRALDAAMPVAAGGHLVTFGIAPTRPETGYGYIETGARLEGTTQALEVKRFVEKPERAVAEAMLAAGGCLWNSGMFLFRADRILAELRAHAPAILEAVERAFAGARAAPGGGLQLPRELYAHVPAAPIDKAVMERAKRIAVVPCDPGWSDLGSWQALWEHLPKDESGNAARGDALLDASENCLIHAEHRLVACSGVRELAVLETADAVLVTDRRDSEAGRRIVALLQQAGRPEATAYVEAWHPWGSVRVLHTGPGFEVNELMVAPGARHERAADRHRVTQWVVVAGTARVAVNDDILVVQPNQSAQIPPGAKPWIENPGEVPVHVIEVRCGVPREGHGQS